MVHGMESKKSICRRRRLHAENKAEWVSEILPRQKVWWECVKGFSDIMLSCFGVKWMQREEQASGRRLRKWYRVRDTDRGRRGKEDTLWVKFFNELLNINDDREEQMSQLGRDYNTWKLFFFELSECIFSPLRIKCSIQAAHPHSFPTQLYNVRVIHYTQSYINNNWSTLTHSTFIFLSPLLRIMSFQTQCV